MTRRLLRFMALWLSLTAALTLVSDRSEADQVSFQTGSTNDLYALQCGPCHGPAGEGTAFGPALVGSSLSVSDRIQIITNGTPAMPAFGPTIPDDQIADLAIVMDSISIDELYRQDCSSCHGANGEGGSGPSLQASTMSDAALLAITRDGSPGMPAFGPILTPEQLDGLVEYIAGFPVGTDLGDRVGEVVYDELCASCHGVQGAGGPGGSLQASLMPEAEQTVITRDGRGGMPAYGSVLSKAELEAVVSFSVALQGESPDVAPPNLIHRGGRVFADSCADCHGDDAKGGEGPDVTGIALAHNDLLAIVSHGQGAMPGFAGQIPPDDVKAVVALLEELAKVSPDSTPPEEPSQVAQGAKLFTDNCSLCHGPDATGGVGPDLISSTMTNAEMLAVIGDGRSAMPGFSAILSAADTDAVVAYVDATRTLDNGVPAVPLGVESGQHLFVAACSSCHGVDGAGGSGPSLTGIDLSAAEVVSQVLGGHPPDMPAFEGVLDGPQAEAVARYLGSIAGEPGSENGWLIVLIGALIIGAVTGGLLYSGALRRLFNRSH